MNIDVRLSTVERMLLLIKKLKEGIDIKSELEELLNHKDYDIEFKRYEGRVSREDFIKYILNLDKVDIDDLENKDLKAHHKYYMDLYSNIDLYIEKSSELKKLTKEIFEEQAKKALKGLPDGFKLPDLNFLFTVGIGMSFGWVYENYMHFDYLQLIKEKSVDEFCSTIAHEIHHVGTNIIYDDLGIESLPVEEFFYLCFTGEGLAVKYCNNAEGVLSESIYDGEKNIGLDKFTWDYLNGDFYNTMKVFKNTITSIHNKEIKSQEELFKYVQEYWMNPYIEGQSKDEIPKLKQFRLYSFGNDIWGIIHDCFGKDVVYDTINNLSKFPEVFNSALEKIGKDDLKI